MAIALMPGDVVWCVEPSGKLEAILYRVKKVTVDGYVFLNGVEGSYLDSRFRKAEAYFAYGDWVECHYNEATELVKGGKYRVSWAEARFVRLDNVDEPYLDVSRFTRCAPPNAELVEEPQACPPGTKYDGEKPRWDLLPYKPVEAVVNVLTHGAQKYADDNWKQVPDARRRYFAAAQRHLTAWYEGEQTDPESGMNHLAHATCCALFLLWFDQNGGANA